MGSIVRRGSLSVAGIAWATALVLGVGVLGMGPALLLSDLVFPAVGIGAGVSPIFSQETGSDLSQLLVGSAYPLGDIFLLVIMSVAGTRRSLHVRDLSLGGRSRCQSHHGEGDNGRQRRYQSLGIPNPYLH